MKTRRETPVAVDGKSGRRWKARYTASDGRRLSAGTFKLKGPCRKPVADGQCCAQHAIDAAYGQEVEPDPQTVGEYAATWMDRHPRSTQTSATHNRRLAVLLDAKVQGRALHDWPLRDLCRRHATDLVEVLLVEQGRAAEGARSVFRSLAAMMEDVVTDELLSANPFRGVRIRSNDRRVRKAPRTPTVFTFEQMHAFAVAAGPTYEGMIRVMADCGLRLGEVCGLERRDFCGDHLSLRGTAHADGTFSEGDTDTKKHVRAVPLPASTAALIMPRIDTTILFPTPTGKRWQQSYFHKRVWAAARQLCPDMANATPRDFRRSWVTNLRAAGIDVADLAKIAGHTVQTASNAYTLPLGRSDDAVRRAIG
jgi:integrase